MTHRKRLPSKDELNSFIKNCAPHIKDIVIFLVRTGVGARETLELDWANVDLETKVIHLPVSAGPPRPMSIDNVIVDRLASLPHRSGRVFRKHDGTPYKDRKNYGGHFKTALLGAAERANVERIGPRVLRKIWIMREQVGWIDVETPAELGPAKKRIQLKTQCLTTSYQVESDARRTA
jgi:integrase